MVDARILRTRAALHAAVLSLASAKPVTSISVSELAEAAGINRVTFYKHYETPAETLEAALAEELDPIRQRFIEDHLVPGADPRAALDEGITHVLDHIERRRPIYELAVATPHDGTITSVLTMHFTETLQQYLRLRQSSPPPLPRLDHRIISGFFAAGLVGAICLWVQGGSHDQRAVLSAIDAFVPAWWFPSSIGDAPPRL